MIPYATLQDVKNELKAGTSADDAIVRRLALVASRRIDARFMHTRPLFAPYSENRKFIVDWMRLDLGQNVFHLKMPIMAVSGVIVGNTSIAVTNVEIWPPAPAVGSSLRLTNRSLSWIDHTPDDSGILVASITGIWGYNSRGVSAWESVDALAAAVTVSSATLTVADADGADLSGFTPRFSPGALVRVDDEYMLVTAVNTTTNVLTVRRAVCGTAAATHASGASVDVWQVEDVVKRVTARYAAQLYAKRGSYEGSSVQDVGNWSFPPDLNAELLGVIQAFAYV